MLISILLVSHNNKKDLELLLPSLQKALENIDKNKYNNHSENNGCLTNSCLSEILLVDNCSSDSTVEFVRKNFPQISIIINKSKKGYGANQNQNIDRAEGKFILIMNPDMILPPDLFNIMLDFMDKHKEAGIAACKICSLDGSCQYLNKREPAIFDLFIRRFLYKKLNEIRLSSSIDKTDHKLFNDKIDYKSAGDKIDYGTGCNIFYHNKLADKLRRRIFLYEMRDTGYDKIVEVPFISGSFMFARADIIRKVKGFDDRFFMYFEDADLCRRVRNIKAQTLYCPDTSAVHRWERASHKSLKWTFIFILSGLKYFHKWGFKFF